MTNAFFALVPVYGAWVLFAATFVACLALPFPVSILMLAGGAFVASGDLAAGPVVLAALAGAVLGDQAGYGLGRIGGQRFWAWLTAGRRTGGLAARAEASLHARAVSSVFLSRWLFSALGPWVNFAAGATRLNWRRFTLAAVLGETLWVAIYVGLGFAFAAHLEEAGSIAGSVILALAAGVVALVLGRVIWRKWRAGSA